MSPAPGGLAPCVIVRGLGDVRAVLEAAGTRPVLLLSPPAAVALLGPAWWVAMIGEARTAAPGTAARDLLDCGDLAGPAQEALALGAGGIVFSGPEAQARRLAEIAKAQGALCLRAAPPALDMGAYGAARRLPLWLAAAG
jgi:hypothetical protein